MSTPLSPRTLRLAASSFDRFIATSNNLTPTERTELWELATMFRAVARGDADLLLSKTSPDGSSGDLAGVEPDGRRPLGAPPADPSYPTDPDGGLARTAADEWARSDARLHGHGRWLS